MANRKLIRPDMNELKKELPARSVRRKQSPPEQTNAEEFYYLKQMAAKTPMVVILDGGEELRGWIEWYDKGAIKLNRHSGPNLLIQKQYIRYMFKEEELSAPSAPAGRQPPGRGPMAIRTGPEPASPTPDAPGAVVFSAPLESLGDPRLSRRPRLALTQGDPAGIGPEILLKLLSDPAGVPFLPWEPVLIAERAAFEGLRELLPAAPWDRLHWLSGPPARADLDVLLAADLIPVLDPVGVRRDVAFGLSGPADAAGAMAALDAGIALVRSGSADALVTAPVSKESIARQHLPGFKGHTDYLAEACGLERYGRDYLMAFLAPGLQVALLTVHVPLREAIDTAVDGDAIAEALDCLNRHAGGKIALAGLNPHAGEGGLLGEEEGRFLVPAVAAARA